MRRTKESPSEQIRRAEERLHILDALATAMTDPRRVLDLIVDAPDADAAESALQEAFGFDAMQANAVTNMQFRQAATKQRIAIERDRNEIAAEVVRMRKGPSGGI